MAGIAEGASLGTALWVESRGALPNLNATLASLAKLASPPLLVLVLYNLPNRDCAAKASMGESTR
jgi:hypothetical protein